MQKEKKAKKLRQEKIAAWVFVIGMVMVGMVGVQRRIYVRSLGFPTEAQASYTTEPAEVNDAQAIPTKMVIGEKVDVVVEGATFTTGDMPVSEAGASYLLQSGRLGEDGNVIVYGHNKQGLLKNLGQVQVGEIIQLEGFGGKLYKYVVEEVQAVHPGEVKWLEQTAEPVITVYTCTGVLDSQRLVVRGRLVEES
jgi:LPXTG-site transpeptidase (sortase) family protein